VSGKQGREELITNRRVSKGSPTRHSYLSPLSLCGKLQYDTLIFQLFVSSEGSHEVLTRMGHGSTSGNSRLDDQ
jgi:hypothetical protein